VSLDNLKALGLLQAQQTQNLALNTDEAIKAQLSRYALVVAGTFDDLDPQLEAAGLEVWLAEE
jgi:hypothetical protein